jgi:iron complex transport system ATP-binding protein
MVTLETHELATGYGRQIIHADLNLRVAAGQLICLIGPNGAGKSTLLRTLAGTQRPLKGSVHLAGRDAHRLSSLERARILSVVLTERITSGLLTGYELVAMGRTPHTSWTGSLSDKDRAVIARAIDQCRAQDLANRPLSEISDGERQRLMLARALAQEPKLLILDEITAFLDLTRRMEIALLLRDIAKRGDVAILLSTHDLDLAIRTADAMWLLPAPAQFHQGPPEELILNGVVGRAFARDGIRFDPASGGFHTTDVQGELISVTGGGLRAEWTRRAIARLGLTRSGAEIDVTDDAFSLRNGSRVVRFETLSQLLAELRAPPQAGITSH